MGRSGVEKQFTRKSALDLYSLRRLFLIGVSRCIAKWILCIIADVIRASVRCGETQGLRNESEVERKKKRKGNSFFVYFKDILWYKNSSNSLGNEVADFANSAIHVVRFREGVENQVATTQQKTK